VIAAELLADLIRQGFSLAPQGDGIRVTPISQLTADLRHTIVTYKPALLALLTGAEKPAAAFTWDQAGAEGLLAQLREALARAEAAVFAGKVPAVRVATQRTWLVVAGGYVRNRDLEAARGWDALALLRSAAARAVILATKPSVAVAPLPQAGGFR
jgi:hypothetical protein